MNALAQNVTKLSKDYEALKKRCRQQQAEIEKVNAEWVQSAMALGKAVQEIHELRKENEKLSALLFEFNVLRKAQEK